MPDIVGGPTARSVLAKRDIEFFGYSAENLSEIFIGLGQYVDLAAEICGFPFRY